MFGDGSKKIKSGTLKDYVVAETEVLNGNNAQYINLRKFSPTEKLAELTVDGLHPNAKGHKLIAEKITEYINNHLWLTVGVRCNIERLFVGRRKVKNAYRHRKRKCSLQQ